MSLYPSLEDMKLDHLTKAQMNIQDPFTQEAAPVPSAPHISPTDSNLYPFLGNYMGLELTEEAISENMPEYALASRQTAELVRPAEPTFASLSGMIAPLSGKSEGLQRAHVTNGIREITLCKDKEGKVGLRVHSVNNGIFVCLVSPKSPAVLAGLRFGDQILEIDGKSIAGYTMDQVHKMIRSLPINDIKLVVRDRPFERTITLHKDSTGHVGFQFKNGKIISLVKDSSAARNGMLTDHHILEINGKNVVGQKDKETTADIEKGGSVITVTVIPSYIYEHMIKNMSTSLLKTLMDHSTPDA